MPPHFYVAFFGLFVFSSADGAEQSWYDQNASRSRLPIVMLREGILLLPPSAPYYEQARLYRDITTIGKDV